MCGVALWNREQGEEFRGELRLYWSVITPTVSCVVGSTCVVWTCKACPYRDHGNRALFYIFNFVLCLTLHGPITSL